MIAAAAAQGRTPGFTQDDLQKIIYSSHQARHEAGLKQHLAATDPNLYGRLMLGMATSPAETANCRHWPRSWCWPTRRTGATMLPEFPLERTLKDADLALRVAGSADLPLRAALSRRWHAAVDTGHGREGHNRRPSPALRQPGTD